MRSVARNPWSRGGLVTAWIGLLGLLQMPVVSCAEPQLKTRAPDVPYEPSPHHVVKAMLELAEVGPHDVVFDLGCGDGRVVIAAVKVYGARGVCIDIDPERIRESRENARHAGVADSITFNTQDLFEAELSEATVVALFLWPQVNLRLRPKLRRELQPGARIVSHMHDMGDWRASAHTTVFVEGQSRVIHRWDVPAR